MRSGFAVLGFTSVNPVLRSLRQEESEFKGHLGSRARPCTHTSNLFPHIYIIKNKNKILKMMFSHGGGRVSMCLSYFGLVATEHQRETT